jgi:hypothetical protein
VKEQPLQPCRGFSLVSCAHQKRKGKKKLISAPRSQDVNDAYPGKGESLFQVNQWLNWLEETEEEDDSDEE